MKIRTIIIDDEQGNIANLCRLIEKYSPDLWVAGTANSAAEGENLINTLYPDLVFLDIQMPGGSGFDMLRRLDKIRFEIIFVTAFDQYGIQAIKFSAIDYLLKPLDEGEFRTAVEKTKKRMSERATSQSVDNLLEYLQAGRKVAPRIALPTLKETLYVSTDEVIRCEAENSYTTFHLRNGDQITVCKTLKEFAALLKVHDFIRTHQSHLVNIRYVKSHLKADGGTLLLQNQHRIPISRQHRESVKSRLANMEI